MTVKRHNVTPHKNEHLTPYINPYYQQHAGYAHGRPFSLVPVVLESEMFLFQAVVIQMLQMVHDTRTHKRQLIDY
jgi:hypothetical protein